MSETALALERLGNVYEYEKLLVSVNGAVQEVAVLTNAFSAEFGWTAGPALNIVTKSGTNDLHGEGLFLIRPGGGWQRLTRHYTFQNHGYRIKSLGASNFLAGAL